jgi:hypothetical protein
VKTLSREACLDASPPMKRATALAWRVDAWARARLDTKARARRACGGARQGVA